MRKHRTIEQWQVLVDQQIGSSLSAMQFCKQEHIGYASFCNCESACPTHRPMIRQVPVNPVFWISHR